MTEEILLDGPSIVFGGPYSNLQATQALLAEAVRLGIPPRRVVCTGDVVAYAADAAATCDLVMATGIPVLAGNCEIQLAEDAGDCGCGFEEGTACDRLSAAWYAHARAQVTDAQRRWMAAAPRRMVARLPDGRRLAVVHGGATQVSRFLFASAPSEALEAEIAATGCDGVLAGHCGLPFLRLVGEAGALWCNAGAIGMPANDGTPRAWFALLEPQAMGLRVSLCPLGYDHAAAAAAMRVARLPEGYASGIETGLWPSLDVLPPEERAATGQALAPACMAWPAAARPTTSGSA